MGRPKGSKNKLKAKNEKTKEESGVIPLEPTNEELPTLPEIEELLGGIEQPQVKEDPWVYTYQISNRPMGVLRTLVRKTPEEFAKQCPKRYKTYEVKQGCYENNPLYFLFRVTSESPNPDKMFQAIRENTLPAFEAYHDDLLAVGLQVTNIQKHDGTEDVSLALTLRVVCSDGVADITITGVRSELGQRQY